MRSKLNLNPNPSPRPSSDRPRQQEMSRLSFVQIGSMLAYLRGCVNGSTISAFG
jgi:hypothetical protein